MEYLVELISRSLHAVSAGKAGSLTLLGMGCVFLALIALDFFMAWMGSFTGLLADVPRLLARLRGRGAARERTRDEQGAPRREERRSSPAPGADRDRQGGAEEIAAAISVVLALEAGAGPPGLRSSPPVPERFASPWRMAARLHQLRPVRGR